jgi:predicted DNA-binding transcriptional regulator YafY
MSKVSNAITMLRLLATGKKYSVEELAKILEVSPRMVRTYKEDLDKSGIFIDTIMGPYGGYVLKENIKIPAKNFYKEDFEILDKYKPESEKDKEIIENLKGKIKDIYLQNKTEKILSGETLSKYNILARGIKERRKVKIDYISKSSGLKTRIIYPAEMFYYDDNWYCVGYCELREDMRQFHLNDIKKIELLDETF